MTLSYYSLSDLYIRPELVAEDFCSKYLVRAYTQADLDKREYHEYVTMDTLTDADLLRYIDRVPAWDEPGVDESIQYLADKYHLTVHPSESYGVTFDRLHAAVNDYILYVRGENGQDVDFEAWYEDVEGADSACHDWVPETAQSLYRCFYRYQLG